MSEKNKKVVFYFDGFNFYNGFKSHTEFDSEWRNYYWIDFVKLCSQFVHAHDGHELHKVKYFTAPPINLKKRSKQSALFGANKIINGDKFIIINGHYSDKVIRCQASCKEEFKFPEEKCTDVNFALEIIEDCLSMEVDIAVLVTADSDQVPTIKKIKKLFPNIKIRLYFPPRRKSNELSAIVNPVVYLENHELKFKNSIMPSEVMNHKKRYIKPIEWKK